MSSTSTHLSSTQTQPNIETFQSTSNQTINLISPTINPSLKVDSEITKIPTSSSSSPITPQHFHRTAPQLNLKSHLFQIGLLNSQLSDIQLNCFGRLYRLHRLVLSQVHFFHALLSGPWNDTLSQQSVPIPIIFPSQIYRSAFEFCLAKIYGGELKVVPPPWAYVNGEPLLLGRTHSLLSRSIRQLPADRHVSIADEESAWSSILLNDQDQPASPNFLCSLLVCANYLGMTNLAEETTSLIKRTITPFTVVKYLTFADGRSMDEDDLERQASCRTLESISQTLVSNDTHHHSPSSAYQQSAEFVKESNLSSNTSQNSSLTEEEGGDEREGLLCHGAPAQKIGQACSAWLSKWATELIALEEALVEEDEYNLLPPGPQETLVLERFPWLRRPVMKVWRATGGLPSRWIRVLVSSDALFLGRDICGPRDVSKCGAGGEWERFGLARRVMDLRDRERPKKSSSVKVDDELARMFNDGIYYSHLSFEQLSFIATDRSPITQQKYVTSTRLQRAHWLATEFRLKLSLRASLTQSSDTVLSPDDLPLYVVPSDRTRRLDELNCPMRFSDPSYFGLGRDIITTLPPPPNLCLLTIFEPKRFSAEFVNLTRLKDKGRLYNLPGPDSLSPRTTIYAGSRFTCYLQRVRQSSLPEPQLGVYVHRLAEGSVNTASNSDSSIPDAMRQLQLQPSVGTHSLFGEGSRLRSALGPRQIILGSGSNSLIDHQSFSPSPPLSSPNVVEAYFVLRVNTMDGTSGTIFESAPDGFAGSQSWGYRSRSMMGPEYLGISAKQILGSDINNNQNEEEQEKEQKNVLGKFSGLRCTVVIGLT
ncbi:hypothetical protein CROQUDRAFT_131114 [Cronartium quercuum f. sp. fusiforme G11]|uniref:BTB domain-containing protein n=1 Tax=Cronartium quercuum f. sp. fusiforme G11 TaxID=708437 RepID=A0A9P6NUE6_9BASI|nr:hypothetical protein CROQUDRAFT_131114 [Cronartium quercuum f. sp. fusiforme G11]